MVEKLVHDLAQHRCIPLISETYLTHVLIACNIQVSLFIMAPVETILDPEGGVLKNPLMSADV